MIPPLSGVEQCARELLNMNEEAGTLADSTAAANEISARSRQTASA
jgi:hypothetical protein